MNDTKTLDNTTSAAGPTDAAKARASEIIRKNGPDQMTLSAPTKALAGIFAIAYNVDPQDLNYLLQLAMLDGAVAAATLVKTTGTQLREEGLID